MIELLPDGGEGGHIAAIACCRVPALDALRDGVAHGADLVDWFGLTGECDDADHIAFGRAQHLGVHLCCVDFVLALPSLV